MFGGANSKNESTIRLQRDTILNIELEVQDSKFLRVISEKRTKTPDISNV